MKKILVLLAVTIGSIQTASAMPCDAGYTCISKTKKYRVELQRCRYENNLHLVSVSIRGTKIEGATLGPSFDADLLAFQVNVPTGSESTRILSIETAAGTHVGILKDKSVESQPAPFKVTSSEAIKCVESE